MSFTDSLDELTEIGELLFVRVGAGVGNSSVVTPNSVNSTVSDNVLRIKIRGLNPFFSCCFFNSTVGQTYFSRVFKGTARGLISRENFRDIFIPQFTNDFQKSIESLCLEADSLNEQSKIEYSKTEKLLLAELGLTAWQPKQQLTVVKKLSDTERAERIDAEYFQPKYNEIVDALKNYAGGWDTLENQVDIKDTNFNPDAETEYKYIELANIGNSGEITDCMVEQGEDLPTRARRKVAVGDVIVSSIEGSLESIALITEEYDNALCSTGFHVVQSDVLNSRVLLVLLKSSVGQLQLKKGCSGTILTAINKEEFNKIAVPIIRAEKQIEIQQKVVESSNLRKRAKDLLEHAKRAVEMAIEQDEGAAIAWLESAVDAPITTNLGI